MVVGFPVRSDNTLKGRLQLCILGQEKWVEKAITHLGKIQWKCGAGRGEGARRKREGKRYKE
jgi:hypothetical protein